MTVKQNRRMAALAASVTVFVFLAVFTACGLFSAFRAVSRAGGANALRATAEPRTYKIGWISEPGMSQYDADKQEYSGYNYDFLTEMNQYLGGSFAFVHATAKNETAAKAEMVKKLADGEIDVLCNAVGDEGDFYYTSSYGETYALLAVAASGTWSAAELIADKPIVAVTSGTDASVMDGVLTGGYSLKEFSTREKQLDALQKSAGEDGYADAALITNMVQTSNVRRELAFQPRAFCFASNSREAAAALDGALDAVTVSQPDFAARLRKKYFSSVFFGALTQSEQAYALERGEIKAVLPENKAPVAYYDEAGEACGIAKDLLTYAAQKSGLKISFVRAAGELKDFMRSGGADIVAAIPKQQTAADAYGVSLSREYLSSGMAFVANVKVNTQNLKDKKLVVSRDMIVSADVTNVTHAKSLQDCLALVDSGKADYTYGNSYCVQYLFAQNEYKNAALVGVSQKAQKISLGIRAEEDKRLLSILNKILTGIPESEMEKIILRNTVVKTENRFNFFYSPAFGIAACILLAAIAVAVATFLLAKVRNRDAMLNNRWKQMCNLTDMFLYCYDTKKDTMSLSPNLSSSFSAQPVIKKFSAKALATGSPDFRRTVNEFRKNKGGVAELVVKGEDGSMRNLRITERVFDDEKGRALGAIGKVEDVTDEKAYNRQRQSHKERDSLTDLYNSAAMKDRVEKAIAEGVNGSVFILLDVDNFKEINERGGNLEGDRVLIQTARVIEDTLIAEDAMIGRLGGDEFIVYIKNGVTRRRLTEIVSALRYNVRAVSVSVKGVYVTLSLGCVMPKKGMSFDELYDRADKALIEAKAAGRNTYEIASDFNDEE